MQIMNICFNHYVLYQVLCSGYYIYCCIITIIIYFPKNTSKFAVYMKTIGEEN